MTEHFDQADCSSKQCTMCGEVKRLDDYHSSIATPDGKQSRCKVCKLKANKKWRDSNRGKVALAKKNYAIRNWEAIREHRRRYMASRKVEASEYRRRWNLAKRYGLTIDQFTEILDSQGGCCAVCGAKEVRQVVDHDHETGMVRGILCVRCNVSIGGLGDTVDGVMRALKYLEKANEKHNSRSV